MAGWGNGRFYMPSGGALGLQPITQYSLGFA
jgi:hypothetical protein